MDQNQPAGIGHNEPPIAEVIDQTFSVSRLAAEFTAIGASVQSITEEASRFVGPISDAVGNERAANLIKSLRAVDRGVEEARTLAKAPLLRATRTVDGFFRILCDPTSPTSVIGHKKRIERLIGDHAQHVARENARLAEEAAKRERERAKREADAAAALETQGQTAMAEAVMEQAVKSDAFADRFEATAAGPIHDLARQQTATGTTGVRVIPVFKIADYAALRATLGALGEHFTADTLDMAVRKYMIRERREGRAPALPGVEFGEDVTGNVR